ncbi:MAG: class I tRNA ligase family protein [Candidatus Fonsibacter sp.]
MYRAVKNTWFVKVESIKEKMIELNNNINSIPANVGESRFHNSLCQAKAWCIARNTYWGTPIPMWVNIDDSSDYIVINSSFKLEKVM